MAYSYCHKLLWLPYYPKKKKNGFLESEAENDTQRTLYPTGKITLNSSHYLSYRILFLPSHLSACLFLHYLLDVEYYEENKNGFYFQQTRSLWGREATDLNGHNISLENDRFHKRGANEVLREIQKSVSGGSDEGRLVGRLAFEVVAFAGCVGLEPGCWCPGSRAQASRRGGLQKLLGRRACQSHLHV